MAVVKICLTQHCKYIPGCNSPPNCTTNGREPYPGNSLFERISYKVTNGDSSAYWICYFTQIKGKKLEMRHFQTREPLDRIDGYYSIQDPNKMLLVALKFKARHKGGKTFYYTFSTLQAVGLGTNKEISSPTLSLEPGEDPGDKVKSNSRVTQNLTSQNSTVNRTFNDKKIKLTPEKSKKDVREIQRSFGDFSFTSFIAKVNGVSQPIECTLSMNNLFTDESKNKIENGTFTSVTGQHLDLINVYYPSTTICKVTNDHAILVELVNDCKKTHIRRINLAGTNQWELVNTPAISYDSNDELYKILKATLYGLNNNIVLLLHRQTDYKISEIRGITGSSPKDSQPARISVTRRAVSGTSYLYCKHDISLDTSASLFGIDEGAMKLLTIELDVYIGENKIDLKDSQGSKDQHIYYRQGNSNKLYVYFYQHKRISGSKAVDNGYGNGTHSITDNIPLLIYFGNRWYGPDSKDTYFKGWKEFEHLKYNNGPTSYIGEDITTKVKEQLNKTNTMLNEIDISQTSDYGIPTDRLRPSVFDPIRVKVEQHVYPECLSFWFYRHTIKNSSGLTFSSFKCSKYDKTIIIHDFPERPISNVEVYYFGNSSDIPLLMGITGSNGETKYYKNIIQSKTQYSVTSEPSEGFLLKEAMIGEWKKKFKQLTFSEGNSSNVNVKTTWRCMCDYKVLTHTSYSIERDTSTLYSGNLFYNSGQNKLDTSFFNEFTGKSFNEVSVYYNQIYIALLVEFLTDCSITRVRRINKGPVQWIIQQIDYKNPNELCNILRLVEICLNNHIIIHLDKQQRYTKHEIKGAKFLNLQPDTIKVGCSMRFSSFKCCKQEINPALNTSPRLDHSAKNYVITELSFIISDHIIELYCGHENKRYLFYKDGLDKIFVYFYNDDPRPLLFLYNSCAYRPKSLSDYHNKWVTVDGLSMTSSFSSFWFVLVQKMTRSLLLPLLLLTTLKDVCNFLNPVHIDKSITMGQTSCEYTIHQYNGDKNIKIKLKKETIASCYLKFIHTPYSGHRLGSIMYNNECVTDKETKLPISAGGFSEVVVLYKTEDTTFKYPILIALKKDFTYRPYYELTSNSLKVYKKVDGPITLDEKTLVPTLDLINYNSLKKLSVVLQNKQGYNPDLIGTTDRPPPKPPPIKTSYNLLTVSQHQCPPLSKTSFTCFKHGLTTFNDVNDVGGLKPFLWEQDDLQLKDTSGYPVTITYTKCKGDFYVYFYQHTSNNSIPSVSGDFISSNTSDTVPLMFSLNAKYYSPGGIDDYFHTWSEIEGINDCNGSNYKPLITELDKVNRMLNRIVLSMKLSYGIPAISVLKTSYPICRVKVSKVKNTGSENSFHIGYTHYTATNGPIGKITLTLVTIPEGIEESDYIFISPNTVVTFFLKLDSELKFPLLIAVGKGGTYTLYYELEGIIDSTYKYRKVDSTIDPNGKDMEQRLKSILSKLSEEDQGTIYKYLNFQDHEKYHKELDSLRELLSSNLMKTIIPVGGTYLVAGASLYPATAMLKAFMALV